jgi:hypothetical protein
LCFWFDILGCSPDDDPSLAAPKEEHLPQLSLFELVYEQHSSFCLFALS